MVPAVSGCWPRSFDTAWNPEPAPTVDESNPTKVAFEASGHPPNLAPGGAGSGVARWSRRFRNRNRLVTNEQGFRGVMAAFFAGGTPTRQPTVDLPLGIENRRHTRHLPSDLRVFLASQILAFGRMRACLEHLRACLGRLRGCLEDLRVSFG